MLEVNTSQKKTSFLSTLWMWFGQQASSLRTCVPKKFTAALSQEPMRTVVAKKDDGNWQIKSVRHSLFGRQLETIRFSGPWPEVLETLSKRSVFEKHLNPIELHVQSSQCLEIKRALPRSALARANNILELEFQRVSPLRLDEVYLDTQINQMNSRGEYEAHLFVLKRQAVATELAQLQDLGIFLIGISISDDDDAKSSVNFLSSRDERHKGPVEILNRSVSWLAMALFVLGAAYFATDTWQLYQSNTELGQRLEKLRKSAVSLKTSLTKTDQSMASASSVRRQRIETPQFVFLLNELTRIIPDRVWISSFSFGQQHIVIRGSARSSAQLISDLSKSALFSGAEFVGPITRNPDTNREQFQLRLSVRTHSGMTAVDTPASSGGGRSK